MNSKELLDEKYGLVKPKRNNLETNEIIELRVRFLEELENQRNKARKFDCLACEDSKQVWRGRFKVTCPYCKIEILEDHSKRVSGIAQNDL